MAAFFIDVSRFDGHYEHVFETTTAGITIQAPQLDINTVAAGGGSMLFYKNGMFVVGPEVWKLEKRNVTVYFFS